MIGRLRGKLLEKHPPELLVEVGGVGYEVLVPMTTLYLLPEPGGEVTLYTQFIVREDAQQLYGFADKRSRALFRDLIKVSGVGPKLALTILSGIDSDDFVRCVHEGDSAALVRLPGVGKKTAERLLVEMRDRLREWQPAAAGGQAPAPVNSASATVQEAEAALIALGYKPQEAARAIAGVPDGAALASEELIRQALRSMIKSR